MLLRGVGTLRYVVPPHSSVQWQPDGLTTHAKPWFLGSGILGTPPISLTILTTINYWFLLLLTITDYYYDFTLTRMAPSLQQICARLAMRLARNLCWLLTAPFHGVVAQPPEARAVIFKGISAITQTSFGV